MLKIQINQLIDSFYKDLSLERGLRHRGVGTNRMNIYTERCCNTGLSNYLNKCFAGKKGFRCSTTAATIATRRKDFADIFCKRHQGISLMTFVHARSFICHLPLRLPELYQHLQPATTLVREYNGYKAYWMTVRGARRTTAIIER